MEKVQQAERGLQSCLQLHFLTKLPKAISPKGLAEQQQQQQQQQQRHEKPHLEGSLEFMYAFSGFFLFCFANASYTKLI